MEEAVVAEDVVGDEDAAIFITTAKAIVKTTFVKPATEITPAKPKAAAIETTVVKPEAAIAKLGKTTVAKPGVAIETTASACRLC